MIYFLLPRESDFTVREFRQLRGREIADQISILHYEDLPTWQALPVGTYILGALDQLYPAARQALVEICDQLGRAGADVRILNSANQTLLRLALLEELARAGLNRFAARRASEDLAPMRFPVFVREEHRHTGSLTPLLETAAELKAALARTLLRGHRLHDLLVIEYCDTRGPDGFFRKYAAFKVGSEIVPRSLVRGTHWMLKHFEAAYSAESVEEERAYVLGNPHELQLRRIFALARTDYGRIDYAFKDGTVETWEINTNPVIGKGPRSSTGGFPPELRPIREPVLRHFNERFRVALATIDDKRHGQPMIPIRFDSRALLQSGPMTRDEHSPGRRLALRRALRPWRPWIDRIAGRLSPILLKTARRAKSPPEILRGPK